MAPTRDSITPLLQSFLPEHLARRLAACDFPAPGIAEEVWAVTLFTDVAGFTPLSEMLTRLGKEGAERLMSILCHHFDRMVDLIGTHGGSVVKYGGDAASVVFVETADSDRSRIALSAVRCAWQMMKAIQEYSRIPIPELGEIAEIKMKIGISCGRVHQLVVGDSRRLEFVAAGRPLDRMAEAEHHAVAGQIVVDREIVELAGLTGSSPLSDGFFRVEEDPGRDESLVSSGPLDLPEEKSRPFLHPMLVEQIVETGAVSTIAEHRKVTVLFVQFEGITYDSDPGAFGKLQEYFLLTQEILRTYDGHLLQLATGDKGSVVFVAFGAPATYENDAERAVLAALELQARAPSFLTNQRIGINTGSVFCGNIGSPSRREYTTLGDATNVAARLMGASKPRQILCSHSTRIRAGQGIDFETLPSIRVKGKSHPLEVCFPIGRKRRNTATWEAPADRSRSMVGREAEIARLREIAAEAGEGRGRWVHLEGIAGIGKSRLAEAFFRMVPSGFSLWQAQAFRFTATKSWSVFGFAVSGAIGEEGEGNPAFRRKRLSELGPDLSESDIELLGLAFGWWAGDYASDLPDAVRQVRIREALERLVLPVGERRILVLENLDWFDPASRELLPWLAGILGERPVLLVTTGRPGSFLPAWKDAGPVSLLALGPLSTGEVRELVLARLPGKEIEPEAAAVVSERSRGIPLFALEVTRELVETRSLLFDEASGRHYLRSGFSPHELPESVGDLVLAKLDRLPETDRQMIRLASVLGESFSRALLPNLVPEGWSGKTIDRSLERLVEAGFCERREDGSWRFEPPLVRDVAYESLAFGRRRELHAAVARAVEAHPDEESAVWVADLARHYEGAGELLGALDCHERGARLAVAAFENPAARFHFDRAIDIADRLGRGAETLLPLLVGRAMVLARLGELPAAFLDQRRRFEIATRLRDDRIRSEACFWMSRQQEQIGDQELAARLARRSLFFAERAGWSEGRIQAFWQVATTQWRQGRNLDCLATLDRLLESIPIDELEAEPRMQVLFRKGLALRDLGHHREAAAVFDECQKIPDSLREPSLRVKILINSAINLHHLGDLDGYEERLKRAREICETTRDHRMRVSVLQNLGLAAHTRGRYADAGSFYSEAAFWARRLGLREEEATSISNEGAVRFMLGDFGTAARLFESALERFRRLSSGKALATQASLAEALAAAGSPGARQVLESTRDEAIRAGDHFLTAWSLTELARLHFKRGDLATGREERARAINLAEQLGNPELAKEARALDEPES